MNDIQNSLNSTFSCTKKFIERKEYNNVISVKLVIPSGCNARCVFCYMNDYKHNMQYDHQIFLDNFITSILYIIESIGDKSPISLDITGNEPTFDVGLLKEVLTILKRANIHDKVSRVTITTNGYHLKEVIPYFKGVIDYVNISVHDFRITHRQNIMGYSIPDNEYKMIVSLLKTIGINTSAVSVIYESIDDFAQWRDMFIEWCIRIGFIGLRFRCDTFWNDKSLFENYMYESMSEDQFKVITYENTPDSHWCRLRRFDGFRVFFLEGVIDTSSRTKGIEYVVADDGLLYCDFYKRQKIQDYSYEIGKIYDLVL